MRKQIFAISTLLAATLFSSVAATSHAQSIALPNVSFKVQGVVVDKTGQAWVQSEGAVQPLTGTAFTCTQMLFHKAANGTANSDAAKDRFANVLLSAQLSGRRVLATITKDPTIANLCILDQVLVGNLFQ